MVSARRLLPLLLITGCGIPGVFICSTDDQCVRGSETGRCEPGAGCSFVDQTCGSGYRYGDFSPDPLPETCVGGDFDAGVSPDGAVGIDAPDPGIELDAVDVADTTLDQMEKPENYGVAPQLRVDNDATGVVRFDLSSLGSGTVVSAELRIWTDAGGGVDKGTLDVFALLEAWDEGTGTGQNGVANWQQRQTATNWSDQGAGPNGSRSMTLLGSAAPRTDSAEVVVTLPAATVQGWLSAPATDFGLALVADGTQNRHIVLVSREGQSGHTPILRVRIQR